MGKSENDRTSGPAHIYPGFRLQLPPSLPLPTPHTERQSLASACPPHRFPDAQADTAQTEVRPRDLYFQQPHPLL